MFTLKTTSNTEEYIELDVDFEEYKQASFFNELQHIDSSEITVEISREGGLKIPDIIYHNEIILISNKFKSVLDRLKVDYIFYKKVNLKSSDLGIDEKFYMIIVPRVDCIDLENANWDYSEGLIPMMDINKVEIIPSQLGRYKIFKVFGVLDNNIYFTDDICEKLKKENLDGAYFMQYI